MSKKMTGPEHVDMAHNYLSDLAQAHKEGDWAKMSALAAAADAHLRMADLALAVSLAPAAVSTSRQGTQWLTAIGAR